MKDLPAPHALTAQDLNAVIALCGRQDLTNWEHSFVDLIFNKVETYGPSAVISEVQQMKLRTLYIQRVKMSGHKAVCN